MMNKIMLKECCEDGFNEKELYGAYKIFFGTLVSESRIKIINLLKRGRKNVGEIIAVVGGDQTAVSHDLARLKQCGFVNVETDGKYRYYALNDKTIKPLLEMIERHMSKYCIHILRGMNGGENEKSKNQF